MILEKSSCPKCKQVLEGWHTAYRDLGNPLTQCPNCRTVIKRDDLNEWELMTIFQKLDSVLRFVFQTLVMSIFLGGLVCAIFYWINGDETMFMNRQNALISGLPFTPLAYYIVLLTLIVIATVEFRSFMKGIKESKERLTDPGYRDMLKTFGLLKK